MRKVERLPTLDCEADYVATLLERTRVQGENEVSVLSAKSYLSTMRGGVFSFFISLVDFVLSRFKYLMNM